ncbi:hypothetical protein [Paenibacillus sp. IITD108]|uniref:hypothetical protein n=1 Tax=Paenibacillus sp. IITD108 TaxID=3116649 RepID=UPI002F40BC39
MKVGVTGKTSRIVAVVQQIKGITDTVFSMDSEGESLGSCDVILLDNLNSKEIDSIWNQYSDTTIAYVMDVQNGIRSDFGQIKELCVIKNIPFITIYEGVIEEEIEKFLFPSRYEGRLQPCISLISVHRKSGASEIARALSQQIADKTTGSIGIVSLDPYDVISVENGITQIYREFDIGGLTPGRIKELATSLDDNLFYIAGNSKLESSRTMDPYKLEQIYSLIQSAFDFTIFVVSPYWDNAMTLVNLKNVKRKYLIATSNRDDMKEFYSYIPQIRYQFELDLRNNSFIFNYDGLGTEAKSSVSNQLSAGCVLQLPYVPGPNPMSKKFTQAGLGKLAKNLVDEHRLPLKTEQKAKGWFFKKSG